MPDSRDDCADFAAGDRTGVTYPDARALALSVDDDGRLRTITDGSTEIATFDYLGEVMSKRSYANGFTLGVTRDVLFRATGWSHQDAAETTRAGFTSAFDALGRKKYVKREHDNAGDAYAYDGLGQLIGVKTGIPGGDLSSSSDYDDYTTQAHERGYGFDAAGNRETVETDGTTIEHYNHVNGVYVPDLLNRIAKLESTTRAHDANGNLIDDGTRLYTYNWRNQLIRVRRKSDEQLLAHYEYDAMGHRVKKYTVDAEGEETGWTTYFVDPETARIYAEADTEGVIQATYVYGNGIDELLSVDRLEGEVTARYYFHEDALGSVVLVTDDEGNNVEKYEYTEYGLPTVFVWDVQEEEWGAGTEGGASAIGNTRMFTGREWDAEVGLYYYRARHYDPLTGRFVSPDPIGMAGDGLANVFRYVRNSPGQYTDPHGLDFLEGVGEGVVGIVGGVALTVLAVAVLPEALATGALYGLATYAGISLGEDTFQAVSGLESVTGRELSADERETCAGRAVVGWAGVWAGGRIERSNWGPKFYRSIPRAWARTARSPSAEAVAASVKMGEGVKVGKTVVRAGGYDPQTNTLYLGDSLGHANGMSQAGGSPSCRSTPGITAEVGPTGDVTWGNDSLSLPVKLTPDQTARVQSGLERAFPGHEVTQFVKSSPKSAGPLVPMMVRHLPTLILVSRGSRGDRHVTGETGAEEHCVRNR